MKQDFLDVLRALPIEPYKPVTPPGTLVSRYRGYQIMDVNGHFEAWSTVQRLAEANTAWGCIVYIDEMLAP